jgi:hypothetical protein
MSDTKPFFLCPVNVDGGDGLGNGQFEITRRDGGMDRFPIPADFDPALTTVTAFQLPGEDRVIVMLRIFGAGGQQLSPQLADLRGVL